MRVTARNVAVFSTAALLAHLRSLSVSTQAHLLQLMHVNHPRHQASDFLGFMGVLLLLYIMTQRIWYKLSLQRPNLQSISTHTLDKEVSAMLQDRKQVENLQKEVLRLHAETTQLKGELYIAKQNTAHYKAQVNNLSKLEQSRPRKKYV